MASGTTRLPEELPRNEMRDGNDLGAHFMLKARTCCTEIRESSRSFRCGPPAWNVSGW